MAPGGDAVGRRADGLVVFVPGGAPGDRALVALETLKKGHARGRLLKLLSPGDSRVDPDCALAAPEACGGCPLMAVNRQAQLLAKADWVRRALRPSRLGTDVEIVPIAAPTSDRAYRLRARLVVRDGRLGFAGARSHRGVAIAHCAVLVPALDRALFTHGTRLLPILGEGATVRGLVGEHAGREAVQLAVELPEGAARRALNVFDALSSLVHDGTLAGAILQDARRRQVSGAELLALGGDSEFGPFFGAADGFAQPSAAGHTLLPRLVHQALVDVGADRVLELHSGSGNLTRAIRRVASQVVCVEGDGSASSRAQQLFADDPSVSLVAQSAEQALRQFLRESARFDAVVLDPPRTGALVEIPLLSRLEARRIVYVSCDPMTLGRDLAALSTRGYVIRRVQPIDLMPHTAHVECVAIADRTI